MKGLRQLYLGYFSLNKVSINILKVAANINLQGIITRDYIFSYPIYNFSVLVHSQHYYNIVFGGSRQGVFS